MILVLDNHDSYTYNLFQILQELTDREVRVRSSSDAAEAAALVTAGDVAALVVSPGPGHPARPDDFAGADLVLDAATARGDVPILGVCLGHQGLARRLGFEVVPAPAPKHGWRSPLRHTGDRLFAGLPQGTLVTRYHSLAIRPARTDDAGERADATGAAPEPGDLVGDVRITAVSEDGVVQAYDVPGRPWWGVQFHPESIATADGRALLANFLALVDGREPDGEVAPADPRGARSAARRTRRRTARTPGPHGDHDALTVPDAPTHHVATRSWTQDPDLAVSHLEWKVLTRGAGSFRIDVPGPDGRTPEWILLGDAADLTGNGFAQVRRYRPGSVATDVYTGRPRTRSLLARSTSTAPCDDVLADLEAQAAEVRVGWIDHEWHVWDFDDIRDGIRSVEELPFTGGFVGVHGYEAGVRELGLVPAASRTPEAVWVRPMRFYVVEPAARRVTIAVIDADPLEAEREAQAQFGLTTILEARQELGREHDLERLGLDPASGDWERHPKGGPPLPGDIGPDDPDPDPVGGRWLHDRSAYVTRIGACRRALEAGDSYELCLTNRFDVERGVDPDPIELFRELRRATSAPYAALLEVDDDGAQLAIVSASPERFVRIVGEDVETKPIKGTAARRADPDEDAAAARALAADPKTFAENLMIVDLLRNDLGRVCEPGSVEVASLMHVESYATLHQLVSTVRGRLAAGRNAFDVVRALHPGGSMTGAPKERTVRILDGLEGEPRGFYAGALGFIGFDGRTELSIVIRTAVRSGGGWSIGAGGAIVLDSDPEAECDEVELKADALRRAFTTVVSRDRDAWEHAVGTGYRPLDGERWIVEEPAPWDDEAAAEDGGLDDGAD